MLWWPLYVRSGVSRLDDANCLMLSGVGVRLRTNANLAFQCSIRWCGARSTAGRVIGGVDGAAPEEIIAEVISEKGAWLIELETMPDHVHLLVEVDPQYGCTSW